MQRLDDWTQVNIIDPLLEIAFEEFTGDELTERGLRIKAAVRQKMLESYRNGQQAGPRTAKQAERGGR